MLEEKNEKKYITLLTGIDDERVFPYDDSVENEFRILYSKIDKLFIKLKEEFSTKNIEWSTSTYKYFHYTKLYIDKIIDPLIHKSAIQFEAVDFFRIIKSLLKVNYDTLEKKAPMPSHELENVAFSGEFEELEDLIIYNLMHERSDFLSMFKEKYVSFAKIIKGIFYENGLIEKLTRNTYKFISTNANKVKSKMRELIEKIESIKSLLFEERNIFPLYKRTYFRHMHEKRCEYDTDTESWECAERNRIEDIFETDGDLSQYCNPMLFCFFSEKKLEQFIKKIDYLVTLLKETTRPLPANLF